MNNRIFSDKYKIAMSVASIVYYNDSLLLAGTERKTVRTSSTLEVRRDPCLHLDLLQEEGMEVDNAPLFFLSLLLAWKIATLANTGI